MTGTLKSGHVLHTAGGEHIEVGERIGGGGEGEVYRATVNGAPKALKWYYPQWATRERRQVLDELVSNPATDSRFLWPESVVEGDQTTAFGYTMRLRPESFASLQDVLSREVSVVPRQLTTAGLLLAEAYQTLHRVGIAYRDISWGNAFIEPATGEVLICDNDNAVFDGRSTEIGGTMEFMAPELVRRDKGAHPSVQTDLHALAVLLFMLFVNHHPLHGKRELEIHCLDEKAQRRLYGDAPLFIFDPDDRANRPDKDEQATAIAMWRFIPDTLRRLFVKAFTVGLRDRNARVRESEWIDALSRCRDSIISCGRCGKQTMTEPGVALAQLGACWRCNSKLESLGALSLVVSGGASRRLLLDPETRVYAHHLGEDDGRHDFQHALAEVREHPRKPGRYGLTNLTDRPWQVTVRSGQNHRVAKDASVALHGGTTITVGACQATVSLG